MDQSKKPGANLPKKNRKDIGTELRKTHFLLGTDSI